jgi:hypothetical protein
MTENAGQLPVALSQTRGTHQAPNWRNYFSKELTLFRDFVETRRKARKYETETARSFITVTSCCLVEV